MSAQDNEATIRRGYQAFNSGDIATLQGIFANDAVWHVAGRGQLAGPKRGPDAILGYFGHIAELTGGTFRAELHAVIANEDHVAGLHISTGQRPGKTLNLQEVLIFHLRDGKVTEVWEHVTDSQTFDEFFA